MGKAYLPKSVVEKNIKERIRKRPDGSVRTDYEAYLGTDVFSGKTVRMTRSTVKELKDEITMFYGRLRCGGDAAVMLSADEAVDARHALKILETAKIGKSITEIVKEYMIGGSAKGGIVADDTVTIEEAFKEYHKSKPNGANRDAIGKSVGKWVECNVGRRISTFTMKEIADYLDANYGQLSPTTYNYHLKYIRTFLNWCANEGRRLIAGNPASHIELKPVPWEEPEYMKPDDVRRLFRVLESHKQFRPDMLAFAVTSFFCGTRSVEIMRIAQGSDAATINLDDETIRIAKGKGFQRGRRPRAFHIEPTALAWMKSFDYKNSLLRINQCTRMDITDIARKHGIPTFQNCGRHTFITYHVAAFGNPSVTQAIVGTSERMRAENYCGLASRADANAYFNILPDPSVKEADPRELRHLGVCSAKSRRIRKTWALDEESDKRRAEAEAAKKERLAESDEPDFEIEIC